MGGTQLGCSDYELSTAKLQTKRQKFLTEMEVVVPLQALIDLIEPHHPKASKNGGRPPHPLAIMLRVHLLQQHGSGERLKESSEWIRSGLIVSLLGVAHNPVIKARLIKNFGHELVFISRNILRNTG